MHGYLFDPFGIVNVGGRRKEKKAVSKASTLNSKQSSEWGLAKETKMASPHRKVERSMEEKRVHIDYDDVVLVASDDDCSSDWCLSGSESDDSDWSIGWSEPLASDFRSNGDGFAVLVPCYKPSCKVVEASNKALLGVIKNLSNEFSSDAAGKNYMEQWLASLQNFEA